MTPLPSRVVIVHTREHVAATHAAAEKTGVAVMLLSAPHIASAGGPLYAKALMGDATSLIIPVLDCGDDPGLAWRAADVGWRYILFRGSDALLEKVRSALQTKETSFPGKQKVEDPTIESSFPRKRESMFFDGLDPRLRGDDNHVVVITPDEIPSDVLDLARTTRKGEVLVKWIVGWMTE